jgi:hypothetical protein
MRIVRSAICLVALACGACGGSMQPLVLAKNNFAFGEPAGFYPGRGEIGNLGTEYSAWLAKNQTGIADIQSRIVEIRNGTRAPGCIGEDKYTCIATLSQRLTVADNWGSEFSIFPEIKYDVNGRPINGKTVMLDAYRPNAKALHDGGLTQLMLDITPNGSVSRIDALLPHDPLFAHTQEEYDKTHIYETVAAVTAKTCPALASPEVARWVENIIKPGLTFGKESHFDDGTTTGRASNIDTKKTAFCGRTFHFTSASGYYHEGFQRVPFEGVSLKIE